jgi:hypothetical protein
MKELRFTINAMAVLLAVLAFVSVAQAQATRTFVSGVGNDADPCSRTAPCRTWAGALIKTFINGEINALDPGGYGTVNITKSVMIDGNGTHASTLASGANGFIINIAAGNANDPHRSVRIRNVSINGTGPSGTVGTRTGLDGIRFISGLSLFVENVLINDFSSDGIEIAGPVGEASAMNVVLNNVDIRNVNVAGFRATHANASGQIVVMLDNVRIERCGTGIQVTNRTRTNANRTVITHNTNGIAISGTDNILNLDDLFVSYCSTGVSNGAGNTVRISDSVVTQNSTGFSNFGTLISLQGNSVFGNTVDGFAPTSTHVKE